MNHSSSPCVSRTVATLVIMAIAGSSLRAQEVRTPPPVQPALPLLVPNRTPADTGRIVWGRQEFTRYVTPNACDRAITHMQMEIERTRVYDSIPYSLEADTLSTAAKTLAKSCGAQFTVEQTHLHQLASLLRISLARNEDQQGRAIVERQLKLSTTLVDSAERLADAITILIKASPPRLADARVWLRKLDALGPQARVMQYVARWEMLDYWKTVYDRDSIRGYATDAIKLIQSMSVDQRDAIGDVFRPYDAMLDLANETQDLAAQDQLMTQVLTDLGKWREGRSGLWVASRTALLETRKSLYGKRTRPLEGQYWFNTGGTPRPASGKMSVLIRTDHTCGEQCFPLYVLIRQLQARYGDAIQVTLITETRGFAPGTGPITPAEEAVKASEYFLRFLKLPVGVLVDEVPFTKRSDGRLEWLTSPIGALFGQWEGVNAILVDPSSSIQWLGEVGSDRDKRFLFAAIDRALKLPSQTAHLSP